MDLNMLKYLISTKKDTYRELAEEMGLHYNTVTLKVSGKLEFTQKEILFFIERYDLSPTQVMQIFF